MDKSFLCIFRQFLKNNRCVIHFRDNCSKREDKGLSSSTDKWMVKNIEKKYNIIVKKYKGD